MPRVFLSYVDDLEAEAGRAARQCRDMGFEVMDFKERGAQARRSVDWCRDEVASSDLVIALIGWRAGSVAAREAGGDGERTFQEWEVGEALEQGIPVFPLLANDSWPRNRCDTGPLADRVDALRDRLTRRQAAAFFGSSTDGREVDDLVGKALNTWAAEHLEGAAGTIPPVRRTSQDPIPIGGNAEVTPQDLALIAFLSAATVMVMALVGSLLVLLSSRPVALGVVSILTIAAVVGGVRMFRPKKGGPTERAESRSLERGDTLTFRIDARTSWTGTGVTVQPDSRYRFRTEGKVKHSFWSGWNDARGNPRHRSPGRMSKLKGCSAWDVAALVGRIGADGTPFLIGPSLDRRFEAAGELFVAINDLPLSDNRGHFKLAVHRLSTTDPD